MILIYVFSFIKIETYTNCNVFLTYNHT